jgi:nitrogen-specific signal transduction histidine kinase/DNA-binding response OmpR family regulator
MSAMEMTRAPAADNVKKDPEVGGGRILVVDDEETICDTLKALLDLRGYAVETSSRAESALEMLKGGGYDLLVSDIRMPEFDGLRLLKEAKGFDPHLMVIMMTGYGSLESAKLALNHGAFDYLTKPIESEQLLHSVDSALRRRKEELTHSRRIALWQEKHRQLKARISDLNALHHAAVVMASTIDLNELLETIIGLATKVIDAGVGSVMLLDHDAKELRISNAIGIDPKVVANTHLPIGESIAGYVAKQEEPLIVKDVERDPRFRRANRQRYETKSLISAPLKVKERVLGVINLNNKKGGGEFDQQDLKLLVTFANQAAVAIDNARLFDDRKRKIQQLTFLYNVACQLDSTRDIGELFSSIYRGLREIINLDFFYLLVVEQGRGGLVYSYGEDSLKENFEFMREGRISLDGVSSAPEGNADIEGIKRRVRSFFSQELPHLVPPEKILVIPVGAGERLRGLLCLGGYGSPAVSEESEHLLSIITSQAAAFYDRQEGINNVTKLATMGRMVAEISHDLRRPLTNLKGTLQILQKKNRDNPEVEEFCAVAQGEIDRMVQLTREILDFSNPNKYGLVPRDLSQLIDKALGLLEREFTERQIKLSCDYQPGRPEVLVYESEILEATLNILLNAVESVSAGGEIVVTLDKASRPDKGGDFARISVSDTGVGIPPENLDRIFERYFTTKEAGTGLGLAVVERAMTAHGGFAEVESHPGVGTTFRIHLPLERPRP